MPVLSEKNKKPRLKFNPRLAVIVFQTTGFWSLGFLGFPSNCWKVAFFSLFLALTVLKKVVVNDEQLTFFVPSHLTEYVIQKFGMTEEKAEEEREKIPPKNRPKVRGCTQEIKENQVNGIWGVRGLAMAGYGVFRK